jgi:hypothetical protein
MNTAGMTPKEALATLYWLRDEYVRVVIHLDTQQERSRPWFCCASLVARFS